MIFNSQIFFLFIIVFFLIYWTISKKITIRNIFILISSYVFYGFWNYKFLLLIIFSSTVDYILGILIDKSKTKSKKKFLLITSLVVNLGLLGFFKYFNFFIESFNELILNFGYELSISSLSIILPVGISFYTFQTLSYSIDIYRGKIKPTKNIITFFAFVSFFPQLVAGPIERASNLLPQFNTPKKFNYELVKSGILLFVFGMFKKVIIADRLSVYVDHVFNDVNSYTGLPLIISIFFFSIQIYCDFSGYSDMAIGISRVFGFKLMKNFNLPYFSSSLTQFWNRWHISLSTWFRDYLYYPLGGNRKGKIKTSLNLLIVFCISGFWHGANWTFIFWGLIHGIMLVFEKLILLKPKNINFITKFFGWFFTFLIVCVSWVFFRANNLSEAFYILKNITTIDLKQELIFGLDYKDFMVGLISIFLLLNLEIYHSKFNALKTINKLPFIFRLIFYITSILIIIIFGYYSSDIDEKQFIYFQF